MGPRNHTTDNGSMNGVFYVQDDTTGFKGSGIRKCDVHLSTAQSGLVTIQINNLQSTRPEQGVVLKVIEPKKWLVYLSQTLDQSASLTLVNTFQLTECIAFEARNEHISVLKMMEAKLRQHLGVISYDIKIQDVGTKSKPIIGTIHIMRNKFLLTIGSPPKLTTLLDYSFAPFENGITLSNKNEINFAALPTKSVLSDQTDEIWRMLQCCMQAAGTDDKTIGHEWLTKTQYVYYNLPKRPCKYIYMNLPDTREAPYVNHDYINCFNKGSVYQNWRSCTTQKQVKTDSTETEKPPPPPPRLKAPPLPPKPKNRPPNSPLPPIPSPRSFPEPPSLPLPRLPKKCVHKEIQYVVYSSKPVIGQIFVIQVVFFQKNDYETLRRIKNLEEEANYQVLKPLPDCISVGGDLKVSLLDIDSSCFLKSERHHVIEHEIVKEAILQSCWLIIEFHLEHSDSMRRNFHGKIVMEPRLGSRSASSRSNKEIQISTTFQDAIPNSLHFFTPVVCNSLKSIGVRRYLSICSLMDIPCALHNDWTGLAGEVGLTVDEVFKIQSRASFPNFSPTNEVLNIWSQRQSKSCNVEEFKKKLENLQRFDVLSVLDDSED